jgi:hypothetical protein
MSEREYIPLANSYEEAWMDLRMIFAMLSFSFFPLSFSLSLSLSLSFSLSLSLSLSFSLSLLFFSFSYSLSLSILSTHVEKNHIKGNPVQFFVFSITIYLWVLTCS